MNLFVTGTDTNIGKTFFSAWLVRQWRKLGHHAAGLKPIACGDREDAKALQQACNNELTLDEINAIHYFSPTAPYVAALVENRPINWAAIAASIASAKNRFSHVVVEGVGGWLVPLEGEKTVREWAIEMNLPVLVVASAGLGTINHTMLTIESIRAAGLPIAGIVLNAGIKDRHGSYPLAQSTNEDTLAALTNLPIFTLAHNPPDDRQLPEWLR